MTKHELAHKLYNPLYQEFKSLEECAKWMEAFMEGCTTPADAMMLLGTVLNTVAVQIEKAE